MQTPAAEMYSMLNENLRQNYKSVFVCVILSGLSLKCEQKLKYENNFNFLLIQKSKLISLTK